MNTPVHPSAPARRSLAFRCRI